MKKLGKMLGEKIDIKKDAKAAEIVRKHLTEMGKDLIDAGYGLEAKKIADAVISNVFPIYAD